MRDRRRRRRRSRRARACAPCRGRRTAARRAAAARARGGRPRSRSRARSTSARRRRARRSRTIASACVASSIIPSISAIPTGSFAPDSPSRIVPVRPPISRSPSTENITAGSVGAIAAPSRPAVIQPRPNAQCANSATSPAVANVPRMPERRDRDRCGAEAPPADRRAAVEEDHDQRDRRDLLDGRDRERRATGRGRRRARRRRGRARPTGSTSGR